VITRFAPAPTGWLHLGHVVNAIYVWGLGRSRGAEVLLRVEDHDRQRSRPEFERGLLDDLDWLGFTPDRFPPAAFRAGPCASRQQDRQPIYARTAESLASAGLLYGCLCSRRDESSGRGEATGPEGQGCPGRCRERSIPLTDGVVWRVRTTAEIEVVEDLLAGRRELGPSVDGDVAVRDRLGNWTYQFAVSVDDFDQRVDLVIRGEDLLESTGKQIQLARLLGRAVPPRFAHHPLVMKSPGRKLSKSDGDSGVRDLARAGWSPEQVIGEAAHQAGLTRFRGRLSAADVAGLFS
jgi:glutamyl-Q tRNA(Asp) synthetase